MKFIDSHAHLDFDDFHKDFDTVLERASEAGVYKIINIGADLERSRASVFLSENHQNILATVGVHPDEAASVDLEEVRAELERLIKSSERVVAVGECGLDYFRLTDDTVIEKQQKLFRLHIEIAREHHLPLVIHIRNGENDAAFTDALKILNESEYYRGVVHCFTFGPREAKLLTDHGFFLGFTGIITYKNAQEIRDAVASTNIEKILIETDCPFLSPQKHRGERNEPAYVVEVAQKIAEIKSLEITDVAAQTIENTKRLFQLDNI